MQVLAPALRLKQVPVLALGLEQALELDLKPVLALAQAQEPASAQQPQEQR